MTTRYAHIEPLTMRAAMAQLPALATPSIDDADATSLAANG